MTSRRWLLPALILILLAGGCAGKKCGWLAREAPPSPPPAKPAPLPEKLTAAPADYRVVQVLASDTATISAAMTAAEQKTLRRLIEAGEGDKPPALPGMFAATPIAGVWVSAHWEPTDDARMVQLDRAGPDGVFSVVARLPGDSREYVDGPLPAGKWSYRMRALGERSASAFSRTVEVGLTGPETAPEAPGSMSAEPEGGAAVRLSWRNLSDDAEYLTVERQTAGGEFIAMARLSPDAEEYLDASLELGSTCSYRVFAVNRKGRSDPGETAHIRLDRSPIRPEAPTELTATPGPEGVELAWQDRSTNETGFLVERRLSDRDQYLPLAHAPANAVSLRLPSLRPGRTERLRLRAENPAAGLSDPSNEVEVMEAGEALATFVVTADPSGEVAVADPGDRAGLRMEARKVEADDEGLTAVMWVENRDPDWQYEEVYARVEHVDAAGVYLEGCDQGPEGCSIDEAMDLGRPIGFQYAEDPYLGRSLFGAEIESYGGLPVRDLFPACGGAGVKWTFRGLRGPAVFTVNLYGRRVPVDFRADPRFDPDRSLWRVSTFAPGVSDGRHEPGASGNPYARPLHDFRSGEVVAVNLSIEAADGMESQPEFGRLPDANYLYWSQAGFVLTFDPAVLRPLGKPVVIGSGVVLRPGVRDPLLPPLSLNDGWGVTSDLMAAKFHPRAGWLRAIFNYPLFSLRPGPLGSPVCAHCFLEGFSVPGGLPQGPDPDDDARLAVVYFQVVGPAGSGSALRLRPWPETLLKLQSTSGTVGDPADDLPASELLEVSRSLAPGLQLPGDYQVEESYICVR